MLPVDAALSAVDVDGPGGHFAVQRLEVTDAAPVQALARHAARSGSSSRLRRSVSRCTHASSSRWSASLPVLRTVDSVLSMARFLLIYLKESSVGNVFAGALAVTLESLWAARQSPAPTDPDRTPASAAPRSRTGQRFRHTHRSVVLGIGVLHRLQPLSCAVRFPRSFPHAGLSAPDFTMNAHSGPSAVFPTRSATGHLPVQNFSVRELKCQAVAATEIDEPLVTGFIGTLPP